MYESCSFHPPPLPPPSHPIAHDLPPVEEQQEQKAVMARTASDPGLQVHYAKPMDLTTPNQPFVPLMETRDRQMRIDAARRGKKAARRKDGGAPPALKVLSAASHAHFWHLKSHLLCGAN